MHELSLCETLIDRAKEEVKRCGPKGRVLGVDVVVGRLSGVHPDSLRWAFERLVPGTILDGARMNVIQSKATCHCHGCEARVEIDELLVECPQCRSANIEIEGGRELLLQSIEIEDP